MSTPQTPPTPDAVTTKVDAAISEVSNEAIALVQSARDAATTFVNSHLPALEGKGLQFASELGAKFKEAVAAAENFLQVHAK